MPSVISGDANVSATEFGFLDGVTSSLQSQIDAKLPLAGGKILQIVRATDSTDRSTTSTSYVDAGISVTITPQKSNSVILLIWSFSMGPANGDRARVQITDSSNNGVSGAEDHQIGQSAAGNQGYPAVLIAWSTPATTSATTYKGRYRQSSSGTAAIFNATTTGQLFAIEVSA